MAHRVANGIDDVLKNGALAGLDAGDDLRTGNEIVPVLAVLEMVLLSRNAHLVKHLAVARDQRIGTDIDHVSLQVSIPDGVGGCELDDGNLSHGDMPDVAGWQFRLDDEMIAGRDDVGQWLARTHDAAHLHNQANIAAEFLDLARKERDLGRRSLIDVLSAETALINASSDAASADTDIALSVYKILNVMGKLTLDAVR